MHACKVRAHMHPGLCGISKIYNYYGKLCSVYLLMLWLNCIRSLHFLTISMQWTIIKSPTDELAWIGQIITHQYIPEVNHFFRQNSWFVDQELIANSIHMIHILFFCMFRLAGVERVLRLQGLHLQKLSVPERAMELHPRELVPQVQDWPDIWPLSTLGQRPSRSSCVWAVG